MYGIGKEDIMMISGPVGSGKSVVLRSLIHSIDNNTFIPIYVRGTALKESDLYKSILVGLNISPPHFPGTAKRLHLFPLGTMHIFSFSFQTSRSVFLQNQPLHQHKHYLPMY